MSPTRSARVTGLLALLLVGSATARAEVEVFIVDPESSRVRIHLRRAGLLKFLGHDHEIDAPVSEGRITADPADPARSSVELRWEAAALAVAPGTGSEKDVLELEERMLGAEVLDAGRHPAILFSSSAVHVDGSGTGGFRLRVRGTLELKGARREVEIPLVVRLQGDELRAHGEVELRLRDLGIRPPSVAGVIKVGNEFRLVFDVLARREVPAPDKEMPEAHIVSSGFAPTGAGVSPAAWAL